MNSRVVALVLVVQLALNGPAAATSIAASAEQTPTPAQSTQTSAPKAEASASPTLPQTPDAASATVTAAPSAASDQAADLFRDREDRLALMLARSRVDAGLLPLARSGALDRAAVAHAQDMVAHGYMDHDAPGGSTPATRAADEGYVTPAGSAWIVVETISAASDEPEGPLGWWLSDAVHGRVLLRPFWRELGVGFAPGGPYGRFWVALFGCRPNVLPPVLLDGTLNVPTEACGTAPNAFGPVQEERVGETTAAAASLEWGPYAPQQPWPAGHPAVVDLRDGAGQQIEVSAADPTGAPTQAP